jgi:hypothetical protein
MISAAEATTIANKTNKDNEQSVKELADEVLEIVDAAVKLACEGDEGLFECTLNLKQSTKSRKDIPDTLFNTVIKSVMFSLKKLGYKVSCTAVKPGNVVSHNMKLAWGMKQCFDGEQTVRDVYKSI